jgi:hypothetical protein
LWQTIFNFLVKLQRFCFREGEKAQEGVGTGQQRVENVKSPNGLPGTEKN